LQTETESPDVAPALRLARTPNQAENLGVLVGSIRRYFPIVVTLKNIPVTAPLYACTADRQRAGWAGSPSA